MSFQLDTPQNHDRGHGQPLVTYPEVKIVQVDHLIVAKRLVLHMQYGETIAGEWVGSPDMAWHQEVIDNFEGLPDGEGGWQIGKKVNGEWVVDPTGDPMEPDPAYDLFMVSTFPTSTANLLYDENASAFYTYMADDGRYAGSEL